MTTAASQASFLCKSQTAAVYNSDTQSVTLFFFKEQTKHVSLLSAADGATVVVTEGRGHVRNKPLLAHGPALTTAPLTVLINQQSASASEIFAGAVRDNCRAILVGKR